MSQREQQSVHGRSVQWVTVVGEKRIGKRIENEGIMEKHSLISGLKIGITSKDEQMSGFAASVDPSGTRAELQSYLTLLDGSEA